MLDLTSLYMDYVETLQTQSQNTTTKPPQIIGKSMKLGMGVVTKFLLQHFGARRRAFYLSFVEDRRIKIDRDGDLCQYIKSVVIDGKSKDCSLYLHMWLLSGVILIYLRITGAYGTVMHCLGGFWVHM